MSSKSNKFQCKKASEEESGPTKKIKLHEMLDQLCFQSQNLESRGAQEVEILHVVSHLLPQCVCAKFNQLEQLSAW